MCEFLLKCGVSCSWALPLSQTHTFSDPLTSSVTYFVDGPLPSRTFHHITANPLYQIVLVSHLHPAPLSIGLSTQNYNGVSSRTLIHVPLSDSSDSPS